MRGGEAGRCGDNWEVVRCVARGGAVWPRSVAKEGQAARVWPRAAQQSPLAFYKNNL